MFSEIVSLVCVALLWGGTNPFLKRNSKDITQIKADSRLKQFYLEVMYLFTNIQYLLPIAINQTGSLLYFITLQRMDLSLAVPVANSLTFVFTAISGWILGEKLPNKKIILGVLLILLGTTLCCYDKFLQNKEKIH